MTPARSPASIPRGCSTPITVGNGPSAIALGAGGVWVANTGDDTVVRIDPSTRAVTTTFPVGKAPVGVAVGTGSVWVANSGDGTVSRIDPEINKVTETIEVGESPQSIVAADGRIWVTVDRQTIESTPVASSGGTVRLSAKRDVRLHGSRARVAPRTPGSCSPPPARSSSTTRTSLLRPAPSW